jgi:Protein kinase domain/HEAT repeats
MRRSASKPGPLMICLACLHDNHANTVVCFVCGKPLWMVTRGSIVGGRYEILSVLGYGGMGVVYKALDRTLEDEVALKILRPALAPTQEVTLRFHSEIKLARRVRNRNVCGIHDYGEDGPLRYIAMELVEGANLREWIRERGPLPADEACDVALQILEGLGAVHDLGIIHRDLKTANLMRDLEGVIRLMDFGLATVKRIGDSPATMTMNLAGTPEYMSPEQVRGERGDFQSDIYALGIILFEILTGAVPFVGDTLIATMHKQLNEPPPLDGVADIPIQLVPVLRKSLAKDPAERYATARGMATALRLARGKLARPAEAESGPVPWLDLAPGSQDENSSDRAEVLAGLVLTLATGDVPERCVSAMTLGRMGPRAKDTVPALVEALNDPHPHVAAAAASALRQIARKPGSAGGPATPAREPIPVEPPPVVDLMDMLHHEDAFFRRIAAEALGDTRSVGHAAVPELVGVLEDRDEVVRRAAAEALGKLGATAAVPSLVGALGGAQDHVRVSAAEALGRIGPRATVAIPALIAALKHLDDEVCAAAADALVRIGLTAAPALIEAAADGDARLRLRAAVVLTQIVAPSSLASSRPADPSVSSQMSPA